MFRGKVVVDGDRALEVKIRKRTGRRSNPARSIETAALINSMDVSWHRELDWFDIGVAEKTKNLPDSDRPRLTH